MLKYLLNSDKKQNIDLVASIRDRLNSLMNEVLKTD